MTSRWGGVQSRGWAPLAQAPPQGSYPRARCVGDRLDPLAGFRSTSFPLELPPVSDLPQVPGLQLLWGWVGGTLGVGSSRGTWSERSRTEGVRLPPHASP